MGNAPLRENGDREDRLCGYFGHCLFDIAHIAAVVFQFIDEEQKYYIRQFNQALETLTGIKAHQVMNKELGALLANTNEEMTRTFLDRCRKPADGESKEKDLEIFLEDTKIWLEIKVLAIREDFILVIFSDQTERRNKELRIMQAEKMEALGLLAGGMAHDFNNLLTVILGYSEVSLLPSLPRESLEENIKRIMTAGQRARNLTRRILLFSRQDVETKSSVFIKSILKEAHIVLKATLPSSIRWEIEYGDERNPVNVNPVVIHEIIMNLCINASHAMDEQGVIRIEIKECRQKAPFKGVLGPSEPGHYTVLSVEDQGAGIAPSLLPHIFEPYFTTKDSGYGSGMGLAVLFGAMKNLEGNIKVETEPGKGSSFQLYFRQEPGEKIKEESKQQADIDGFETLMVVDDEPDITDVLRIYLEDLGFLVETFTKSTEAHKAFMANPDRYDLVITDQTMPDINGLDLSEQMLCVKPDLPILLCTGYSNLVDEKTALARGIKAFYTKPLQLADMALGIRRILDEC